MNDYIQLIKKLFTLNYFTGHKNELENVKQLNHLLGQPDKSFQIIHIAGTNGKGSVSTKIAKGLQLSGYKVGLYTSPHIATFRERIQINGQLISQKDVVRHLKTIFSLCEKHHIPATFFETTTLLALLYYREQHVDYVVLEAGLGGRLDSTNFVQPILTLITSIGMDHSEILGNTLEQIAEEKAGIIKQGTPVVIGPKVPLNIIKKHCENKNSPMKLIKGEFTSFDEENSAIAEEGLKLLDVNSKEIEEALKIRPPCRFQAVTFQNRQIILDVAHNPDGLKELFKAILKDYPTKKYRILFSFSKNKDIKGCLHVLKKYGESFYPVSENYRCISTEETVKILLELNIPQTHIHTFKTLKESFIEALPTKENEILVVCGTFYIMKTVRNLIGIQEESDPEI